MHQRKVPIAVAVAVAGTEQVPKENKKKNLPPRF